MPPKVKAVYLGYSNTWDSILNELERISNLRIERFVPGSTLFDPRKAERCAHHNLDVGSLNQFRSVTSDEIVEYMYMANRMSFSGGYQSDQSISGESFYEKIGKFKYYFSLFCGYLREHSVELVLSKVPHLGLDYTLWLAARKCGIPTVACYPTHNPNAFLAVDDLDRFLSVEKLPNINSNMSLPIPTSDMKWWYMSKHPPSQRPPRHRRISELTPHSLVRWLKGTYGRVERTIALQLFLNSNPGAIRRSKKAFREGYRNALSTTSDLPQDFVYFPLHFQHEFTTAPIGKAFADQLEAIMCLRALVPGNVAILVKENPWQSYHMRDQWFFERLRSLSNTYYLAKHVNTNELIEKCQCVATIAGTAGWEAICRGKPAIVFGRAWYSSFPGVYRISPNLTYDEVLEFEYSERVFQNVYETVCRKLLRGVLDPCYRYLLPRAAIEESDRLVAIDLCRFISEHFRCEQLEWTDSAQGATSALTVSSGI